MVTVKTALMYLRKCFMAKVCSCQHVTDNDRNFESPSLKVFGSNWYVWAHEPNDWKAILMFTSKRNKTDVRERIVCQDSDRTAVEARKKRLSAAMAENRK